VRWAAHHWRERFRALWHPEESPWRLALSLAVGVFISFTPFYGVQTLLSVVVAAVCRLNTPATIAGTWINLPWFAPFVYAGALKLGAAILPDLHGLRGMSVALLVGTTILGTAAGVVTYVVALGLIARRRRRLRGDPPVDPHGDRRRAA
jgi:uncharacterized protein (DUF2062 family)